MTLGNTAGHPFLSDNTEVSRDPEALKKLLRLIGEYKGWSDSSLNSVFVSDRSELGDFDLSHQELREIGTELGFVVQNDDYLKDIAKLIAAKVK